MSVLYVVEESSAYFHRLVAAPNILLAAGATRPGTVAACMADLVTVSHCGHHFRSVLRAASCVIVFTGACAGP